MNIIRESIFIENDGEHLHIQKFHSENSKKIPVLMIHGSVEDGRIFYSKNEKGLGPYLAKLGYEVFIPDLRGRGKSTPKVGRKSKSTMYDILEKDFDVYLSKIKEVCGTTPQIWVGHSWGGVLLLAYYAKKHKDIKVSSMVFLGVKRRISIGGLKKLFMVNFYWRFFGKILTLMYGYLPSKKYGMGSDNESRLTYLETDHWVKTKSWKDKHTTFDYHGAFQEIDLPPILSLTGIKDDVLGHPTDVQLLLKESNAKKATFKVLGKKNGNLEDYDHINILTSKAAENDHFLLIYEFIRSNYNPS